MHCEADNLFVRSLHMLEQSSREWGSFVDETKELRRVRTALEDLSQDAADLDHYLTERDELSAAWAKRLEGLWDRLEALAQTVWNHQLGVWVDGLDADLRELWENRPQ
jgi:hypothetical protein